MEQNMVAVKFIFLDHPMVCKQKTDKGRCKWTFIISSL